MQEAYAPDGVGVGWPNVGATRSDEVEKEVMEEMVRSGLRDAEEEEIIEGAEVVIDRSAVELLTFRNKIGIFIGVIMIVLTISGGWGCPE